MPRRTRAIALSALSLALASAVAAAPAATAKPKPVTPVKKTNALPFYAQAQARAAQSIKYANTALGNCEQFAKTDSIQEKAKSEVLARANVTMSGELMLMSKRYLSDGQKRTDNAKERTAEGKAKLKIDEANSTFTGVRSACTALGVDAS